VLVGQVALPHLLIEEDLEEILFLDQSLLLEVVVEVEQVHHLIDLVLMVDLAVVVEWDLEADLAHIQVHQTPIHLEWDIMVELAPIMELTISLLAVAVVLVEQVVMELHQMVLAVLVVLDHRLQSKAQLLNFMLVVALEVVKTVQELVDQVAAVLVVIDLHLMVVMQPSALEVEEEEVL
tara:strand:- start:782 stop:1318 length:537 start_codon:yes stop_codon:yes gene_type:complete